MYYTKKCHTISTSVNVYNDGLYDETARKKKYIHLRNFTFGILLIYTYNNVPIIIIRVRYKNLQFF